VVDKVERNYDWKFLGGNVRIKKGRDHEKCNYVEGNQHPRARRFDYDISMGKI